MSATLAALLSHWRRHLLQLAALVVGLALATALWSGVQALNAEARASYARAASLLGGDRLEQVAARTGDLGVADFAALRRAGWPVSPVLEGDAALGDRRIHVIGVEPLTLPPRTFALGPGEDRLAAFLSPGGLALAAPETAADLAGDAPLPLLAAAEVPVGTLVVDIGQAERLLGRPGAVSRLILGPGPRPPLPAALAERVEVRPPAPRTDFAGLTESFHLNLTAFGFLSFFVGLFIVYAAIGLAFEQRRPMLRSLRACGVSARDLALALALELGLIALSAGAAGMALGYGLAAALLPDVAASLRGLYGAPVSGELALSAGWWAAGLAMAGAGALAAGGASLWRAFRLPLLASGQPEAWRAAEIRRLRAQGVAALALVAAGLGLLTFGQGLAAGFALMGCLLLAAALILPGILAALLAAAARAARGPTAQWVWADARAQLSGLSMALMALLIAIAVSIGVGTMVGSFRQTFLGWLDQRLGAEVYLAARDPAQGAEIAAWIADRPGVAILPIREAETVVAGQPVEVYGFADDPVYRAWPTLALAPGGWDRAAAGAAVMVSEQLARRAGLAPGDPLVLPGPAGPWATTVAGVYSDYGNTLGQVLAAGEAVAARWPDSAPRRFALRVAPAEAPALAADLRDRFDLGAAVTDQAGVKAASIRIFDRTFAVTLALDALTLGVAGAALFASLLTLAELRLAQVAPVWALGLTRRRLAAIEAGRALALAALTALAALPVGLALAWILTAIVNVEAFGWRLPVVVFPGQWARLFLLALAAAALAAAWPAWRLRRAAPLDLLRSFSNER